MAHSNIAYVRTEDAPHLDPPPSEIGLRGWLWKNIFSSMANYGSVNAAIKSVLMIVLTVFVTYALIWMILSALNFALFDATFSDPDGLKRDACIENSTGACWPFVKAKFYQFVYGFYPADQAWRINIVFAMLAAGVVWTFWPGAPGRRRAAVFMLIGFPILAYVLLTGGPLDMSGDLGTVLSGVWFPLILAAVMLVVWQAVKSGRMGDVVHAFAPVILAIAIIFGIFAALPLVTSVLDLAFGTEVVASNKWGGLTVTLVVAIFGIVLSLPIGVILALGRQSNAPIIKYACVIIIEVVRGIPLISVLFFASAMLPYFLEPGVDFDKLLRAMVGVAMFASAYMAEVIRGGLQAMPKGQYEGGMSLGLSYWQQIRLIILPQAMTTVIPGIVNTFIGLFKDTTLVLIISIFDLLGILSATLKDPEWSTPTTAYTGYLVIALTYWVFCFGMSRYSIFMEHRLDRGHR